MWHRVLCAEGKCLCGMNIFLCVIKQSSLRNLLLLNAFPSILDPSSSMAHEFITKCSNLDDLILNIEY